MKKLIAYYSLEGNTRLIAETIADALDADILEIKPVKEIPSKGFLRYVWGGAQVAMRKEPELIPMDINPADYDIVIIGTPVWNGSYTPPVRSFLKQAAIKGKKVGYFACYSGGLKNTFNDFSLALGDNDIIGEKAFINPLANDEQVAIKSAREWASLIAKKI